MTTTIIDETKTTQVKFQKAARRAIYVLPFYILAPALFALAFHFGDMPMQWKAFGFGALGWVIALFLRVPLSALVMKMQQDKANAIIVSSSGVLEESVRIAMLALTGMSYAWAVSLGQGWATVEVLFTMVNVIVILSLSNRTDDKAMQAKEMLRMQGNLDASPVWGIVERVFASALHIGFTLIVVQHPWTVAILIPLHSLVNLTAVHLQKKQSIVLTEAMIAIVGTSALVIGILLSI